MDIYHQIVSDLGLLNTLISNSKHHSLIHDIINSFENDIYAGDLNRDGVKEIYICDMFGTTIRYVIKDYGIATKNDDIDYGYRYLVCDFNCDDIDDYIFIDSLNENVSLFMGK